MTEIYYKPYQSRSREAVFFQSFMSAFLDLAHRREDYSIPTALLDALVETSEVLRWLERDTSLAAGKRAACLSILSAAPAQLKVALKAERISCDIVVVHDGRPFFWEFHEEQHRSLNVSRPGAVYAVDGTPYLVPRFVQRLIRDIWRALYLRPYTIVWSDWFAKQGQPFQPLLRDGFHELASAGRFTFQRFCGLQ
jgi:hypothetical protein